MRILFYAVLAYVVWRVIQAALKIVGNPGPRNDPGTSRSAGARTYSREHIANIEDAQFEDITPPKKDAGKTPPPSES